MRLPRRVWNHIQRAFGIRFFVANRRRNDPVAQRHDAGQKLHCAGSADQMAVHGFGGRDHQPVGMGAEHIGHSGAFGFVIGRSTGAMGVDIAHFFPRNPCIRQSPRNRPRRPLFGGHDNIGGVRGHAKPGDFAQNIRPARPGVFIFLEHEHPRPLALHHAVAGGAERAAGVFGHHPQPFPGLDPAETQHRLGPAGDHCGAHAGPDHLKRQPHRVIGRGAGGGHGECRAFDVILHRHMAGRCIVHQLGHHKRMHPVLAFLID